MTKVIHKPKWQRLADTVGYDGYLEAIEEYRLIKMCNQSDAKKAVDNYLKKEKQNAKN